MQTFYNDGVYKYPTPYTDLKSILKLKPQIPKSNSFILGFFYVHVYIKYF